MTKLVLSKNYFGDAGGFALLDCLHNINELEIADCKLSSEMKSKIKERAREITVTVNFCGPFNSEEKTSDFTFFKDAPSFADSIDHSAKMSPQLFTRDQLASKVLLAPHNPIHSFLLPLLKSPSSLQKTFPQFTQMHDESSQ